VVISIFIAPEPVLEKLWVGVSVLMRVSSHSRFDGLVKASPRKRLDDMFADVVGVEPRCLGRLGEYGCVGDSRRGRGSERLVSAQCM
jgi:hypothetical protein